MKSYKEAAELALAFSAVIREMQREFSTVEHLPVQDNADFEAYQMLMSRIVLLQRDMEELLDRAMALEATIQDSPVQVLDFSAEWESYD